MAKKITKLEVDLETVRLKYEFRMAVVSGITVVGCILSFGIPLWGLHLIVGELAGKDTRVDEGMARLVGEVLGGGSALAVIAVTLLKMKRQNSELKRLRARCDDLESKLLPDQ